MNINMLIIISIVAVTICTIYIMRNNKIEAFSVFNHIEQSGPKDYQFSEYVNFLIQFMKKPLKKHLEIIQI